MSSSLPEPYHVLPRRIPLPVYVLGIVVTLIMAFTWIAPRIQVDVIGFLVAEGSWSKMQKQVVMSLDAYAGSGSATDYATFQRHYADLRASEPMREAMARPGDDPREITRALGAGELLLSARSAMRFVVHYLSSTRYMNHALADWQASNRLVAEFGGIAAELHGAYAAGTVTPAEVTATRLRVQDLDTRINVLSTDFSRSLAQGAEWFSRVLLAGVLGIAGIVCLLWFWLARRVVSDIRGSEERYRLLFDSAPDAIVMVDERDGRVLAANRAAVRWMGENPADPVGLPYDQWCGACGLREVGRQVEEAPAEGDGLRVVETQVSRVRWKKRIVRQALVRDVSERVEREKAHRIAAKALASITEGVIIADAALRIVSVNAAACRITGFMTAELVGKKLDWSRSFPDGTPLTRDIWDTADATGSWSGEVQSLRRDGTPYPEQLSVSAILDPKQRVLQYVAVFSDVSAAKADRARLEQLAKRDPLTGLANREEFQRRCDAALARAAEEHRVAAVLFMDLDAFKVVNDSYGHAIGDQVLRLAGARIRSQLRECDTAARIGGDEFAVLLQDLAIREDAAALGEQMLAVLRKPFQVDEYEVNVTASMGVASYPQDAADTQGLISNANSAVYAAKREERDAWRFFTPPMLSDARHHMRLVTDLRRAIDNDEFRLVYQPIVDVQTRRITAAEALLRWQHPEYGQIMPVDFIDLSEGIGLARSLGEWVIRKTCEQMHAWDESGLPNIPVSVNVSAGWFGHPAFIDGVRQALHTYSVAPARILLEITESTILRLGEHTMRTMQELATMGMRVAIDDFGTGYASMAYLKLPAVACLKIDRSFISGLPNDANDTAITSAVLAMANTMRLNVVAEGVETEAQHRYLMERRCTLAQGFLYSHPLTPAVFEEYVRAQPRGGRANLRLVGS
ncbi:MAG TPA: EAL domain-containing protein [Nevskiaceae bacterium]